MIVYRYLRKEELINIKENKSEELGKVFYGKELSNNHEYKPIVKYMHFFKKAKSMNLIRLTQIECKGTYYFCKFNIPKQKLLKGKGLYYKRYKAPETTEATEYIFDAKDFNSKFLINYQKDEKREQDLKQYKYESRFDYK